MISSSTNESVIEKLQETIISLETDITYLKNCLHEAYAENSVLSNKLYKTEQLLLSTQKQHYALALSTNMLVEQINSQPAGN